MATLDRGLRIVSADAAMLGTLGDRARREVCGTPFLEHLHPSARTIALRCLERLVGGEQKRLRELSVALVARDTVLAGEMDADVFTRDAGGVESIVATLRPAGGRLPAGRRPAGSLDAVDRAILEGLAGGASTQQLAAAVHLSRGGVEYHVTALMRRMGVPNRTALVAKAFSSGLFEMGTWPPELVTEVLDGRR